MMNTSTYGLMRIIPHFCHGETRAFSGPAGTGSTLGSATLVIVQLLRRENARCSSGRRRRADAAGTPALRPRGAEGFLASAQPATCLMRTIISSTALSTGTLSLTTRLIAFAQTFSLLRMVNL